MKLLTLILLFSVNSYADGLSQETENGGVYRYKIDLFYQSVIEKKIDHKMQLYCHGDYKIIDKELTAKTSEYSQYNISFFDTGEKYYEVRFECLKKSIASN